MISIVIPVYNCYEYTLNCLEHLQPDKNLEIIIVDNGSTDDTYRRIMDCGRFVHYIRNEENRGFAGGINQGMSIARGDQICWLNNDVVVSKNWLPRLIWHMKNSNYDLIGPMSNFIIGYQRVKIGVYSDTHSYDKQTELFYQKQRGKSIETNWIGGLCFLITREVFNKIGYLDERFEIGNAEEIDYCFRAKDEGFKIGVAEDVYVHHYGNVTFKAIGGEGFCEKIGQRNLDILREKWGDRYKKWENQLVEQECL